MAAIPQQPYQTGTQPMQRQQQLLRMSGDGQRQTVVYQTQQTMYHAPPQHAVYQPPQQTVYQAPPQHVLYQAPQQRAVYHAPPRQAVFPVPPQQYQYQPQPVAQQGYPSANTQSQQTPQILFPWQIKSTESANTCKESKPSKPSKERYDAFIRIEKELNKQTQQEMEKWKEENKKTVENCMHRDSQTQPIIHQIGNAMHAIPPASVVVKRADFKWTKTLPLDSPLRKASSTFRSRPRANSIGRNNTGNIRHKASLATISEIVMTPS